MKNGFTLIELLATIVIIAVIATITTVTIGATITNSKKTLSKVQIKSIEDAAKAYYLKEGSLQNSNEDCISIGELISKGYIEADEIKDPKTNEAMTGSVEITNSSNQYYYTYKTGSCTISFSQDSWGIIAKAVRQGTASGVYHVGDTKEIDLGAYGKHIVRIANMSTPAECSTTGYSQTACGFVVEFTDIITTYDMNPTGIYNGTQYDRGWNIDGYPASQMYTFLRNDIYNALPANLKNVIVDTTVVSSHGYTDSTNFTSTDKLYLLAPKEIWNEALTYDSGANITRQLDYYNENGVTTSSYAKAIKNYNEVRTSWWLRSSYSRSNDNFYIAYYNGDWGYACAYYAYGVSPSFRIE